MARLSLSGRPLKVAGNRHLRGMTTIPKGNRIRLMAPFGLFGIGLRGEALSRLCGDPTFSCNVKGANIQHKRRAL